MANKVQHKVAIDPKIFKQNMKRLGYTYNDLAEKTGYTKWHISECVNDGYLGINLYYALKELTGLFINCGGVESL